MGQAGGGLLQQGDGLQAEVGKVLLLHILQETRRPGRGSAPGLGPSVHSPLSLFKVIQFYLEKSCLQLSALTFGIKSAHFLLSYFKKGKFY